jgi:hypothetical protein
LLPPKRQSAAKPLNYSVYLCRIVGSVIFGMAPTYKDQIRKGAIMFGGKMRLVCSLSLGFLACCSVPELTSEPGRGPSVRQILNHINCELASIIASNPSKNKDIKPLKYYGPIDPTIEERQVFDPALRGLIPYLQENHFVASVLLTLDTTDTEGVFPTASFIINPTVTVGLGAQVNGLQERNVSFGYSIDLANVADGCYPWEIYGAPTGLNGNLRLGDIIADGLTGLDATNRVNVYSSGGPTRPAFDAAMNQMKLGFTCSTSSDAVCPPPYKDAFDLTLSGNVNFAPASDPESPGTISFAGRAKSDHDNYVMNLTGSTIQVDSKRHSKLKFTLSGTMTKASATENSDVNSSIGYSPNIALVGSIFEQGQLVRGFTGVRGLLTPSSEVPPPVSQQTPTCTPAGSPSCTPAGALTCTPAGVLTCTPSGTPTCNPTGTLACKSSLPTGAKVVYTIGGPITGTPGTGGGVVFNAEGVKFRTNRVATGFSINAAPAAGASPAAGTASATVKSSASSSASSTQFGSLVNFMITYGLNGGPNWTLSTFKGPGGGTGPGGALFSATRAHTATLQITFVAACNDDNNPQTINSFWQSIPKCNGTQQAQAAAAGQALNYLVISGRGGS